MTNSGSSWSRHTLEKLNPQELFTFLWHWDFQYWSNSQLKILKDTARSFMKCHKIPLVVFHVEFIEPTEKRIRLLYELNIIGQILKNERYEI